MDKPAVEDTIASAERILLIRDRNTADFNPDDEANENARLQAALEKERERNADEIVNHILADNARFAADAQQFDDITCLALRYRP
jgi:hypothetical protein